MNFSEHDIYKAIEEQQPVQFYRWLGASVIGHNCRRYIALQFRCAFDQTFSARILRVFENGHKAEDRIVADLRKAGVIVEDQQRMIDLPGALGHAGVTLDGIVVYKGERGVLEMKTSKSTDWNKLHKSGVKEAKRQHYCQMQFGMLLTGLRFALYVSENKDTNELHVEVVAFNQSMADDLVSLALGVVANPTPSTLTKCSDRDDWYECNYCSAKSICKGTALPRVHCLTCAHARAVAGGQWLCGLYDSVVPVEHLAKGCANHIYTPWMVNRTMIDWGDYWISYESRDGKSIVCNCPAGEFPAVKDGDAPFIMTSQDMHDSAGRGEI